MILRKVLVLLYKYLYYCHVRFHRPHRESLVTHRARYLTALILFAGPACQAQQPWQTIHFDPTRPHELVSRRVTHADGSASNVIWLQFPNGHGGWFILDTGASFAAMDRAFADQLALPSGREITVNGQRAILRTAPSVDIGRLTVTDPVFVALDLAPLTRAPGSGFTDTMPAAGLIGYSFLQSVVLRLEYGDSTDRVFLDSPSSYTLPAGEWWRQSPLIRRTPSLPANVAGTEGVVMLDTGKSAAAGLSADFVAKAKLDTLPTTTDLNHRIGGAVTERVATIPFIELAEHRVERPVVSFRRVGDDVDREAIGIVGRELLKWFTITFDYAQQRISLVPRRAASR